TLKDIADMAGVSISTVSRVMNNKSTISEATRKKILSAAQELKFKQGIVSQVNTDKKFSIAIVVPGSDEYYHNDPQSSVDIRSLTAAFEQAGHDVELFFYQQPNSEAGGVVDKLKVAGKEGVLLCDPLADSSIPVKLEKAGIPFVVTNGIYNDSAFYQIDYDNYQGMYDLMTLVLDKGHRYIGVITGPLDHMVTNNRLDAVRNVMSERQVKLNDRHIKDGSFSLENGHKSALELMEDNPAITVMVCFSDYIAMGAMKAVREKGLRIPEDISVTGFDDIEMSSYVDPPLTTVHRFNPDGSLLIARALLQKMEYKDIMGGGNSFLKTTCIERPSLGVPAN
ncbi:MAG: LacI family DNA-binding transcriptional regulator, partial [Spirochaetales bacterium]|nr:LacI family DNA-binding transcriptional regulator [Spirochaetales bacterium]